MNRLGKNLLSPEFCLTDAVIGIIGYGRFGKLLYEIFRSTIKEPKIRIYSPHQKQDGDFFVSLETLAKESDVIMPAVPIRVFKTVINQLSKQNLKPNVVVMDVCSVKKHPVNIMLKNLPPSVNIIASHPMFGPATYKKRGGQLQDLKMVMWNVRGDDEKYSAIKKYFKSIGLKIVEMSPDDHDKFMAKSQFITQTVAWLFKQLDYRPTNIDTGSAAALFEALTMVGFTQELYIDMIEYNPYAKQELEKMIQKMKEFKKYLN